jgi:DNA polymerase III delta prime subunit
MSGGDLRKAINILQMAVSLDLIENLDVGEILKISGFMDNATFEKLINSIKTKDFYESLSIFYSQENLDGRNFIRQICDYFPRFNFDSNKIPSIISFIGDIDYKISNGANEKIQLSALIGELIQNTTQ